MIKNLTQRAAAAWLAAGLTGAQAATLTISCGPECAPQARGVDRGV